MQAIQEVVRLLGIAERYTLPENGIVSDPAQALTVLKPEDAILPAPVVALQFHVSDFSAITAREYAVTRRIALCLNASVGAETASPFISCLAKIGDDELNRYGGIIMIPIYFIEGMWIPNAFGSVLLSRTTIPAGDNVFRLNGDRLTTASVPVMPFPLLLEMANSLMDEFGTDQALRDAGKDTNDEMLVLATMLAAKSWQQYKAK